MIPWLALYEAFENAVVWLYVQRLPGGWFSSQDADPDEYHGPVRHWRQWI